MNAITSLNKQLTDLNSLMSRVSNQAMKAEQGVRAQEEKYATEQRDIAKKQELNETIAKCKTSECKVKLIPLESTPPMSLLSVITHFVSWRYRQFSVAPRSDCSNTLEGKGKGNREKTL